MAHAVIPIMALSKQAPQVLSKNHAVIEARLRNNHFTSHQGVNELISSLGLTLLHTLYP